MDIDDMLFVGFNRRIAALDLTNGEIIWSWKAGKGTGFVTVLLDRGILFASVDGYTYAIDPKSGTELWLNSMKGFGTGITSLSTTRSSTAETPTAPAAAEEQRRRRATAAAGGAGG